MTKQQNLFIPFFLAFFSVSLHVQSQVSERDLLISDLTKIIRSHYVSDSIAKKMVYFLEQKYSKGGYSENLNEHEFAYQITKDLRNISGDQHILVLPFFGKRKSKIANTANNKISESKSSHVQSVYDCIEYGDIAMLNNGIGLLEFRSFNFVNSENQCSIKFNLDDVMNFLQPSRGLVIDLRKCLGGSLEIAEKVCSYFNEKKDLYFVTQTGYARIDSSGDINEIQFTNERLLDTLLISESLSKIPIVVLTSRFTFSAAEVLAYKLGAVNSNVVIVGEKTFGSTNTSRGFIDGRNFKAVIPYSKLEDKSNDFFNIEGNGVLPNIVSSSENAINIGIAIIREKANLQDYELENIRYFYNSDRDGVVNCPKEDASNLSGNYSKFKVEVENGCLYLIYDVLLREKLTYRKLRSYSTRTFSKISFHRNLQNNSWWIQAKRRDGYEEIFRRIQ